MNIGVDTLTDHPRCQLTGRPIVPRPVAFVTTLGEAPPMLSASPEHALSKVFRGKFLDALRRASQAGELPLDPADTDRLRQARMKELTRHDWVVDAKTPLAGPEVVLDCLSRYTHRVAVSNERIVGIDTTGVRLRVRADDHGGKRTTLIDGQTFIGRFLQHVLPSGFKRIRHYGLLSAATKSGRLAKARAALAMPAANAQAREDAAAFIKRVAGIDVACCPHCRLGHWQTTEVLQPTTHSRHGEADHCRGPP